MWVKVYNDGTVIQEDKERGLTWLKTPLDNIKEAYLINGAFRSETLRFCTSFWHSRSAWQDDAGGTSIVAERIQGQRGPGEWSTITWTGDRYVRSTEKKAIGKPILE